MCRPFVVRASQQRLLCKSPGGHRLSRLRTAELLRGICNLLCKVYIFALHLSVRSLSERQLPRLRPRVPQEPFGLSSQILRDGSASVQSSCSFFIHGHLIFEMMGARRAIGRATKTTSMNLAIFKTVASFALPILYVLPDSDLCRETHLTIGCHACSEVGCCSSSRRCHAKCTLWPNVSHVCPSVRVGLGGCQNCGHTLHRPNADPRCAFYQRAAGQLAWHANAQQLLDTQPGRGSAVPHMNQLTWSWCGVHVLKVDGKVYDVGRVDPGGCNDCLIDSFRQCLGLGTDPRKVRRDLMLRFAKPSDARARGNLDSKLDLDSHWQTLLRSLFKHNACGVSSACDVVTFNDDLQR